MAANQRLRTPTRRKRLFWGVTMAKGDSASRTTQISTILQRFHGTLPSMYQ
jgi:hypothetical protein